MAVVGAVVVCVLVVLVWWAMRGGRQGRVPAVPAPFHLDTVAVDSPELKVEIVDLAGNPHDGRMDWTFKVVCRDPEGCRAGVRLAVHYLSGGEPRRLVLNRDLEIDDGGTQSVGAVQRVAEAVDAVERVAVTVQARFGPEGTPDDVYY